MNGFVILEAGSHGLDFVDCTPTISRTLEEAKRELAEWYGDTPAAAIYRLEKVEGGISDRHDHPTVRGGQVSARDELADVIARRRYAKDARPSVWITGRAAREVADAILAGGYRKPRVVTTEEELNALPFETVIRDGDDCVLERWGDLEESGWVTVMVTAFIPRDQITLPATVIYEGARS